MRIDELKPQDPMYPLRELDDDIAFQIQNLNKQIDLLIAKRDYLSNLQFSCFRKQINRTLERYEAEQAKGLVEQGAGDDL